MAIENDIASPTDSMIGQTIESRYVIRRKLGEGGIGCVYLAADLKVMGREVVVKILLDVWLTRPDVLRKFEHEKEALSRLNHPNIISILDSGVTGEGKPFFVMPYVAGRTLDRAMDDGLLDWKAAADIIEAVAGALSAAHSKGVLHRDIKPSNIMVAEVPGGKLRILLIDFGIARVFESQVSPVTEVARPLGTVLYVAPEQLDGGRLQTPAGDIYSLGIVAYEILTGQLPFEPESMFDMMRLQLEGPQLFPSQMGLGLSERIDEVIKKALAYDPTERYGDAGDFAADLCGELRHLHYAETNGPRSEITRVRLITPSLGLPTFPSGQDIRPEQTPGYPAAGSPFLSLETATSRKQNGGMNAAAEVMDRRGRPLAYRTIPVLTAGLLVILFAAGIVGWAVYNRKAFLDLLPVPAVTEPVHRLQYALVVQEMRGGKPLGSTYRSDGREVFKSGTALALYIKSNTAGHLYLFSESPNGTAVQESSRIEEKGGWLQSPEKNRALRTQLDANALKNTEKTQFYLLFPTEGQRGGSSDIAADEQFQTEFNEFGGSPGGELLWIVWTKNVVPELENALKSGLRRGSVDDSAAASKLRSFLQSRSQNKIEVSADAPSMTTTLSSEAGEIVYRLEFQHR